MGTGRGGRRNNLRRNQPKPTSPSHLPVNPTTSKPSKPQPTGKTLPAELLLEILYRTEVKSLVRFMCVCKSWYGLITHPKFVKKHFCFNSKCNSHAIFNAYGVGNRKAISLLRVDKMPIRLLDIDYSGKYRFDYPRKINFTDFSKKMHVTSSINGVVLLMNIDEIPGRFVVLWNPAINQWKPIKIDEKAGGTGLERSAFGLGYDEGNNDLKIIRVVTRSTSITEFYKNFEWARVEVYSVNRGCWKDVDHEGELLFWPRQYHCNFIVKGAHYFVGIDVMPDCVVEFQH
ncbi:hypothetical protein POM88_023188 [Heracleum sosnowskyi]|uniref:F-box domain-containing protein n=1 Tax=Heracleum sosnowskyi TaxID=360622 RepID=A0AAD8IJ00_9APIA|nr:hypothetical protein POM88_023188 [Heracleum sosnowskyi]